MTEPQRAYPVCPKCRTQTRPATDAEKAIYGPIASMPGLIVWQCPQCGEGGVRPG
jgi:hypothetical protein